MHMQVNPPLGKRTIRDWKRMEVVVEPGIQISDDAQQEHLGSRHQPLALLEWPHSQVHSQLFSVQH